MITEIVML